MPCVAFLLSCLGCLRTFLLSQGLPPAGTLRVALSLFMPALLQGFPRRACGLLGHLWSGLVPRICRLPKLPRVPEPAASPSEASFLPALAAGPDFRCLLCPQPASSSLLPQVGDGAGERSGLQPWRRIWISVLLGRGWQAWPAWAGTLRPHPTTADAYSSAVLEDPTPTCPCRTQGWLGSYGSGDFQGEADVAVPWQQGLGVSASWARG